MDHLLPSISRLPIEIPILDLSDYDGDEFESYPERQNWGPKAPTEWSKIFDRPPQEFLAFLQRWLFFGLLSNIFGQRVMTSEFRRDSCGKHVLTTASLASLALDLMHRLESGIDTSGRIYIFLITINDRLHQSAIKGQGDLEALFKIDPFRRLTLMECLNETLMPKLISSEILMSIHLVSEFLMTLVSVPCGPEATQQMRLQPVAFQGLSVFETSVPWVSLNRNWCDSELPVIFGQFNTSSLLLLKTLKPPLFFIATPEGPKPVPCKSCKPFECVSRKIHDNSYKTMHTNGCTNCEDFVARPEEVLLKKTDLKNGLVPLVAAVCEDDTSYIVRLVPAKPSSNYVAISHVWSDGLGNLKSNALPRCQMLRLGRLIRKLPGKQLDFNYFWIDTLCVPPDEAGQIEAQQVAIEKMRETYENAAAVLVLDSWLLSSEIGSRLDVDILTQIFASHWNRRLWTFHEGALAKSVYFQFVDGAYNLDQGIQHLISTKDLVLDHTLKPPVLAQYFSLRGFRKNLQKCPLDVKICSLFAAFRYRQTSVASDEAICLAALLDLPVGEVLSVPGELRMAKLWAMTCRVPVDFLFYEGETHEQRGLRWAPRTLLRSGCNIKGFEQAYSFTNMDLVDHKHWAEPTFHGLKVWLSGLIFISTEISLKAYLYLEDESRNLYRFTFLHSERQCSNPNTYPLSKRSVSSQYLDLSFGLAAFILNGEEPEMSATGLRHQGILAAINPSPRGFIYASKLCTGYCETITSELHSRDFEILHEIPLSRGIPSTDEYRSKVPAYAVARWTIRNQCWIVD